MVQEEATGPMIGRPPGPGADSANGPNPPLIPDGGAPDSSTNRPSTPFLGTASIPIFLRMQHRFL